MIPRVCIRNRFKHILVCISTIAVLQFFGVFTHIFEVKWTKDFRYPIEGDVVHWAEQLRRGIEPDIKPVNVWNETWKHTAKERCQDADGTQIGPRVVLLVKSAIENFDRRSAIRKSWGFEARFSDVEIRTVFLLGVFSAPRRRSEFQKLIDIESDSYHDIVQSEFIDAYFNNTLKTMMGFRWSVEFCTRARFYMFVDDDYYVSMKNVLRFIRNPVNYPEYLEEADETLRKLARKLNQSSIGQNLTALQQIIAANPVHSLQSKQHLEMIQKHIEKHRKNVQPAAVVSHSRSLKSFMELAPDVKLYAGFVMDSKPHRHHSSKWYVSLSEYQWSRYPPYIPAGAYILSQEALHLMYYTSMFTQKYRFDDIFLAIVAIKALVEPLHCEKFHFYRPTYTSPANYRYVIAAHDFGDPQEMVKIWHELRAAGHA